MSRKRTTRGTPSKGLAVGTGDRPTARQDGHVTPTGRAAESTALHDNRLMAAASGGSVDAFAELYDRYCTQAYRVAMSVCREDGCAQNAVQEAFVSIWRTGASYRSERGTVAAWLLTVVRNRAIDLARRSGAVAVRRASESHLNDLTAPDDVCDQALRRETANHLHGLLDVLPDVQREVITLAFYGQLTHTEIAEHLGLPTGTVKSRMRLGLHKLRANIETPPP